jgi:hypothetical protein
VFIGVHPRFSPEMICLCALSYGKTAEIRRTCCEPFLTNPMNWYYVDQGQQAGPVDDAQLEELRRSGKIDANTLIWREGMANWLPYSQAKAGSPAPPPPVLGSAGTAAAPASANEAVCTECGRIFPMENMIRHGGSHVCAGCKPVFMQKLAEGASVGSGSATGMLSENDLLARDYEVDIGGCISNSWDLFKANAGIMIGGICIVYGILMVINLIPYVSLLSTVFLAGPLTAGLWLLYIRLVRRENPPAGDVFTGFGPRYWQLVLAHLAPAVIVFGVVFVGAFCAALLIPLARRSGGEHFSPGILVFFGILGLIGLVLIFYFSICWAFALPLVADKKLKFWPALQLSRKIVSKHWGMTFLLFFVCSLIGMVGLLACIVGALVTGPTAFGAIATHYNRVFGDLAPNND